MKCSVPIAGPNVAAKLIEIRVILEVKSLISKHSVRKKFEEICAEAEKIALIP